MNDLTLRELNSILVDISKNPKYKKAVGSKKLDECVFQLNWSKSYMLGEYQSPPNDDPRDVLKSINYEY